MANEALAQIPRSAWTPSCLRSPVISISRGTLAASLIWAGSLTADPIPVRHLEGLQHGFLIVRSEEGKVIANGELSQQLHGDRVTSHLVYRFHDGSVQDETAVYSQRRMFHLLSHHIIQKGPAFKRSLDMSTSTANGQVTVHYDDKGEAKTESGLLELPPDLANGIASTLLKNLPAGTGATFSLVAATPKPRLVKLEITPDGQDSFRTGNVRHTADRYRVHVKIGGIAGAVAPIIGKQPSDTRVWILQGAAPAFLKSEGPFYDGGPVWRIELVSPTWKQ